MQVTARLRYAPGSAQKMRLVADLIRGKGVQDAVNLLEVTNKVAARHVQKCLKSAIANAENNNKANIETLRIKEAVAQTATTLKRFTPKARGSAGPILKRNCHVKIVVSDE